MRLFHSKATVLGGSFLLFAALVGVMLATVIGGARAAGPAFVQVVAATPQTNQSTVTVTYSKAQVAGDTNIIAISWNNITSNITNVTDSKGNSYAVAAPTTRGSDMSQAIYYAKNISSAATNGNTVTVTFSAATQYVDLRASEYSGLDTASPFDKTASATGTTTAAATPSVTTTYNNELIFAAGGTDWSFSAAGSGFTKRIITSPDADITEDKTVSVIGSYNATATQTGSWVMQMATFKASGSTSDTTPPSVPAGLTAASTSGSQATLSWTASTDNVGVTGYRVYRNGTQVGTTSSTTYTDTGLTANTTYSYTVSAYDAAGNTSAQTSAVNVTTLNPDTTPPITPTSLTATPISTSEIDLSWTASTDNVGVSGYKIYRNGTQVATSNSTTYHSTGLSVGTSYSYTVSAYDAAGNESPQSTAANATTLNPDTTPPSVPTGLSIGSATSSQLTVTWTGSTDNVGVSGYKIYRNGTQVGTTSSTTYTDTGLTANTTYSYTVSAYDAAGNESAQSSSANGTTQVAASFPFAAGVSANHRYLLDQNGNPYMIIGDSPHTLIAFLTEAEATTYFADRQAHDINSAWVELLTDPYVDGRSDMSTYDGLTPFTTAGDFSKPNPAYFQRALDMVNIAAQHGVTVFLDPMETGGLQSMYEANGPTKDYNYGVYLGNLFRNSPNVVWITGNDFQTWSNSTDDADVMAIANGIKSTDPNHLQTTELNYERSSSLDDSNWANIVNLNGAYTYFATYDEVLHAYNQSPTTPAFLEEANYEFENLTSGPDTTNQTLRRQSWWTMLSGATGELYGNHYTWATSDWNTEQANLDTPGVTQMQYMENLLSSREWYNLVPDQSHAFLTAGQGTYDSEEGIDVLDNDYATAAVTPDGALGMVYVPTARTVTINLSKMAGNVTARWYDPSNNSFKPINGSPFAPGSGSQQFTTPGTNNDGDQDWVLVLDGNSAPDNTAPSTPANLSVGGTTSSTATLSWTASTDNVGVSGYKIYRNGTQVGTTSSTTYTDTGLTANTTYSYTVSAYDFAGNTSSQSTAANVTTGAGSTVSTPAFVQLNSATPQSNQSSTSVAYTLPQNSGDTNVIVVGFNNTSATISSVTDSNGNTYSLAAPLTRSGKMSQAIYYAKNIKAASTGGNIVTVKFSTSVAYPDIRVVEYSGLDQNNPVDAESTGIDSGNSGNATTTTPAELLFGAGSTYTTFSTAGSGYTLRVITSPDSDIVEDRNVTSIGTYNATATDNGSDNVMQIVTFRAAGQ